MLYDIFCIEKTQSGDTASLATLSPLEYQITCLTILPITCPQGNFVPRIHMQENSLPQGGVLSCTLFTVKRKSLQKALPPTFSSSMYVDDVQVSLKSFNLPYGRAKYSLV